LKLLDVNVVLAAHRDDHPDFGTARAWLDQTIILSHAPARKGNPILVRKGPRERAVTLQPSN
jgi:hypothetical protein